ncbi:MAG TPA: T9SS type A sorting domain-containing protein [Crocinitomix sp.]|nr:T9SS type A sorting domain-containing protein [Crocinitomix sp.]
MTVKSISTSKNITIKTENNSVYNIEICTYLGTTVFKDTILPKNKIITIKGLNSGKYIINISNELKLTKQQIEI